MPGQVADRRPDATAGQSPVAAAAAAADRAPGRRPRLVAEVPDEVALDRRSDGRDDDLRRRRRQRLDRNDGAGHEEADELAPDERRSQLGVGPPERPDECRVRLLGHDRADDRGERSLGEDRPEHPGRHGVRRRRADDPEHDRPRRRIVPEAEHEAHDPGPDAGRVPCEEDGGGGRGVHRQLHRRDEEPLLGPEVVMDEGRVHAGPGGDRPDRRAVEAGLGERGARRGEDPLAGVAGAGPAPRPPGSDVLPAGPGRHAHATSRRIVSAAIPAKKSATPVSTRRSSWSAGVARSAPAMRTWRRPSAA